MREHISQEQYTKLNRILQAAVSGEGTFSSNIYVDNMLEVLGLTPEPSRSREELHASFEKLRKLDEEICASMDYQGCCDVHGPFVKMTSS